jgi:hypothetical protein
MDGTFGKTPGEKLIDRLRDHVTGAIERGEATAIVEIPAADPRARGFNYGAPVPIDNSDTVYRSALALGSRLHDIAHQANDHSWRLDRAVRDYRHATSHPERTAARIKLNNIYNELQD